MCKKSSKVGGPAKKGNSWVAITSMWLEFAGVADLAAVVIKNRERLLYSKEEYLRGPGVYLVMEEKLLGY
jgi:hypothetical protein